MLWLLNNTRFFHIIAYRMGRLCGGAHEIKGIKAPIFLRGWVGGGGVVGGGVGGGEVGGGWGDEIIFSIKFKFSKIVTLV